MAWTCKAGREDDLRAVATAKFDALQTEWQSYDVFWRLGHSFDTVIDYFAIVDKSEALTFAPTALAAFGRSLSNACWYDDYGWWGIAALKASQHPDMFKADDTKYVPGFAAICNLCWDTMHYRGTAVWDNNQNDPTRAPLRPRFDGGVWNCDWTGESMCGATNAPPELPTNPPDRDQGANLSGIQNTVTNGLYLVLASRLAEVTGGGVYMEGAKSEFGFLSQWFAAVPSDVALLQIPNGGIGKLVRERVATYAGGTKAYVNGYVPELSWSGDQGIILGGLIDRMMIVSADKNPQSPPFLDACAILNGVANVTNSNSAGVLQPWTSGDGGDPGDYATGMGVFMRYLLYADQRNVLGMRKITRGADYQKLIDANVQAVLNNKVPHDDADLLTDLTNCLAILVAAIVMCNN